MRPGAADYYNLTISVLHTYAVGALQYVVHNSCGDSLPAFKSGGKTKGIFFSSDMSDAIPLESGYRGPSADMPSGTPGISKLEVRSHVEAHAASLMRQNEIQDADLWINNPSGPCTGDYGCHKMLPHMLPEGANLRVHFPDGAGGWITQEYTGLSDALWNAVRPGR